MADPISSKLTPATRTHRGGQDSIAPHRQLGLFAKVPTPGRVKTRLSPPLRPEEASLLYAGFLEDLDPLPAAVGDCEPTLFLSHDRDTEAAAGLLPGWRHAWQADGDLGARLERALEELHGRGGPAVILGSDHPDLPPALVRQAFVTLAEQDLVLGPTPDGGYYLIGTARPQPGLLEGIEWSTQRTAEQTEERARQYGLRTGRLKPWPDVDTWDDVRALAARLESGAGHAPVTAGIVASLMKKYAGG